LDRSLASAEKESATIARFMAGRIVDFDVEGEAAWIVVQPCAVVTAAAIIDAAAPRASGIGKVTLLP
jgi:hypothetical protein